MTDFCVYGCYSSIDSNFYFYYIVPENTINAIVQLKINIMIILIIPDSLFASNSTCQHSECFKTTFTKHLTIEREKFQEA